MNRAQSTSQPPPTAPVITLIGAGSRVFSFGMCTDICQTPALRGAELRLVDVDAEKLATMQRLFERVSDQTGMGLKIGAYTDRRAALPGTAYVILSVAVDRVNRWERDLTISRRHGIVELQGECGGPGGLSLTLRNIPLVLAIARDIEQLAPDALLLNFTNPMTRVCLALSRYTKVQTVGLCHGLLGIQRLLKRLAGRALRVEGCGINHFNWVFGAEWADTKTDAWPAVTEAFVSTPSEQLEKWLYTRELFQLFGRIPAPDDRHIADFVHHWRGPAEGLNARYATPAKKMGRYREMGAAWESRIQRYLAADADPMSHVKGLSGEGAIPIICAVSGLAAPYEEIAVNIPNNGCIPDLPDHAVVEVPGKISQAGVQGRRMGPLPDALRSLILRQLEIADLAVAAAVEGDRAKARAALAVDPIVTELQFPDAYLTDILESHADLLPQFS